MLSENGLNLLPAFLRSGFFPIINIYDKAHVLRVAAVMRSFSINIMEVTVRSAEAFACIEAVRKAYPEMVIGAGTILSESAFVEAQLAGAHFFVSPCFHSSLVEYALHHRLFYIPAVMTPSELFCALEAGFRLIKIFPAHDLGTSYIQAIAKPFARFDFRFLPTGGIGALHFADFLKIPHVAACGISSFMETDNDADVMETLSRKTAELCAIRDSVRGFELQSSHNDA